MYSVKPTSINNKDRLFRRNKKDLHLKFIVIGDSRVGKTTLVEKYCGYDRDKNQNSQLYYQHTLTTAEWSCNLKIVDTAGQERYRSVTSSYYRGSQGCLIVFDTSEETSFVNIEHWYNDLMNYCNSTSISIVLVGIKRDSRERVVSTERAQSFADHLNLPYFEVNLDNNSEISDVFDNLIKTVAQTLLSRENSVSSSTLSTTRLSKAVTKAESKLGCSCC
ncbi:uncharacterized protein LOC128189337 [Crassostrea angulata]|uniref:uncharacterized protein LOC128189337 n=1 Tax=Magallana angulata TaxID=2784310 RepID=UPI0022B14194|nr:uncharacterized protein LOC128189337 [Crassostrea angulata]